MASRSRKRPGSGANSAATAESTPDSPSELPPRELQIHPDVFNGQSQIEVDGHAVHLRHRYLAAFLAWLVPGAGHYYQGRRAKATLFLVSILSIWFLGFSLGGGHVVYASWQPGDKRWHYFLQAGVGAAALPALIQNYRMNQMTQNGRTLPAYEPWWGGFMAPPRRPVSESEPDEVAAWYARSGSGYELGTWFTMIAGLLNVLVIYDAYGGPLAVPISGRRDKRGAANEDPDAAKTAPE